MACEALPDGWVWTKLGEIIEHPQYGWTTSSTEHGTLHFVRTTDISSGDIVWEKVPFAKELPANIEKYTIKEGDILVSRAGSVGVSILVTSPKEAIFASYLIRIRPLVDAKFISYYLKSPNYWKDISDATAGIALPNINATKLAQLSIPLPPLAEQRRIVAKIDRLFKGLDIANQALNSALEKEANLVPSLLYAASTGELTKSWRIGTELESSISLLSRISQERRESWVKGKLKSAVKEYPGPQKLEESDLPSLPSHWTWASLDQLVKEGCPIVYGVIKPGPDVADGVPIVKVNNIVDGELLEVESLGKCSHERAKRFPRSVLREGDLVISKDGSIGRVGLVPKELEGGNVTQHVMKVTPHTLVHGLYIMRAIQSPFTQKWLKEKTKGVALQGVNVEDFRKIPIPLPPYEEQLEIARKLGALISYSQIMKAQAYLSLESVKRMRQSIMERAFEGNLVPQDLNDEPASVLIERVRAGQQAKKRAKSV